MRLLWYAFLVYRIAMPVPSGLVDTALTHRTLRVGNMVYSLPRHVDVNTLCAQKRNGYLFFEFDTYKSNAF